MTLVGYVRRRAVQAVITLLVLTLIVHAGITVIPGDPVRALFGVRAPSPARLAELRGQFRLDDPYPVQYFSYLGRLLRGDLGSTINFNPVPVRRLVAGALPVTGRLVFASIALQMTLGYALAVVATLRRRSIAARSSWWLAVLTTATPVILSAYVLRSVFTIGYRGLGWFPFSFEDDWRSYLLPVAALALMLFGPVALLLHSEMLESLGSNFARFSLATGLSRRRVVGVHVAKASAGAAIAYVSANLGYLMTGVAVVETAFGIPGIGSLIIRSIQARDRPTVIGGVLVVSVLVVVANMIGDIVAAAIDPRLRFESDVTR